MLRIFNSIYSNYLFRFKSEGTSGTAKFKIVVEATEPDCDALYDQPSPYELCPNGPCCSGDDCCIVSIGEYPQTIKSKNYPEDSGRNLTCSWKLQAPEGFLVSVNFADIQMRQDSGSECNNDFVKLVDPHTSAHSVLVLRVPNSVESFYQITQHQVYLLPPENTW